MDYVARTLLAAICRSSLLRLRADAFSPVLDDLPPPRGSQGSSLLTARSFSNNFCHLSPAEYSSVAPLFADPQVLVVGAGGQERWVLGAGPLLMCLVPECSAASMPAG